METVELKDKLASLDKAKVASEVIWWICENVKNFVDTKQHSYALSFLAHEEKMPETARLEALCRQIDNIEIESTGDVNQMAEEVENNPEVAKAAEMQTMIVDFLEDVRGILCADDQAGQDVMKAFAYYQDFVGYTEKGEDIKRPLNGFVEFKYLSFENADMSITITPKTPVCDKQGRLLEYKRDPANAKTIEMPASFCLDLVVQLWEDKGATSLF